MKPCSHQGPRPQDTPAHQGRPSIALEAEAAAQRPGLENARKRRRGAEASRPAPGSSPGHYGSPRPGLHGDEPSLGETVPASRGARRDRPRLRCGAGAGASPGGRPSVNDAPAPAPAPARGGAVTQHLGQWQQQGLPWARHSPQLPPC